MSSQKNRIYFFLRKRHLNMDVLKNFLFLKIDFPKEREHIRAKIWFTSGKRWLANNMTGQADVRLCKLGAVDGLVNECFRRYFFSLSSQRSKIIIIIITPDLRLYLKHSTCCCSTHMCSHLFRQFSRIFSGPSCLKADYRLPGVKFNPG